MDIEAKHHELDLQIDREQKRKHPDHDLLVKLKKEKLHLKDQLYHH